EGDVVEINALNGDEDEVIDEKNYGIIQVPKQKKKKSNNHQLNVNRSKSRVPTTPDIRYMTDSQLDKFIDEVVRQRTDQQSNQTVTSASVSTNQSRGAPPTNTTVTNASIPSQTQVATTGSTMVKTHLPPQFNGEPNSTIRPEPWMADV